MRNRDKIEVNIIEAEECRDFDKRIVKRSRWRIVAAIRRWLFRRVSEPTRFAAYHTVGLSADGVMDMVYQSSVNMRQLFGAHGGTVYMGPDQFYKCADEATKLYGPVSVPFTAIAKDGRQGLVVLDMTVVMLPWMDGVLVVPKD